MRKYGAAPTRIDWQLPAGVTAGPIEWPHPQRLPAGPLMNFGYDGDTLLLTTLSVPADLKPGTPITLKGTAEWLECKDVCIPGSADLVLTLPVKETAAPSTHAALFNETRKLIPAAIAGLAARGTIEGDRIRLSFELPAGRKADTLEFFPLEEARVEPAAAQMLSRGDGVALYLTAAKPVKAKRVNQTLMVRNLALEAEVRDLKEGLDAVEERARNELGMIRQDEVFFQILDGAAPSGAAP